VHYVTSLTCRHTQACDVQLLIGYDSIRSAINCILLVSCFKTPIQLKALPSVITSIKSRRIRWAGHVALVKKRRMIIAFWWESQKERDVNWENYIKINHK
jgi:hypothetical protein